MQLTKNEIVFYVAIAIATLLTEIANQYGAGICVYPPLTLIVMFIGFKAFPPRPNS